MDPERRRRANLRIFARREGWVGDAPHLWRRPLPRWNDSDEFDPLADPGSREALALQKAERGRRMQTLLGSCRVGRGGDGTSSCGTSSMLLERPTTARRTSRPPPPSVVKCAARGRNSDPQSELDAAALRRAEDDDLARAIALSSDAAPQQGDADLAAAIDLRGRRRGDDFPRARSRRRSSTCTCRPSPGLSPFRHDALERSRRRARAGIRSVRALAQHTQS